MTKAGHPVLAVVGFPAMSGTVLRPLVDPVPLSPVSLVWRKGFTHPGLDALRRAAAEFTRARGSFHLSDNSWIPAMDIPVMMTPF